MLSRFVVYSLKLALTAANVVRLDIGLNPVAKRADDRIWKLLLLAELLGEFERVRVPRTIDVREVSIAKVDLYHERQRVVVRQIL